MPDENQAKATEKPKNVLWLDFNDAALQSDFEDKEAPNLDTEEIRQRVHAILPSYLADLYPNGYMDPKGRHFRIGDISGTKPKKQGSLVVELRGEKIGQWYDHSAGKGGDIFHLWAAKNNLHIEKDFQEILTGISARLGDVPRIKPRIQEIQGENVSGLGPVVGRWDYLDKDGNFLFSIWRHEPSPGKKTYRPYNKQGIKCSYPEPRPLYNIPGMLTSKTVVLAEGEKCAQALIDKSICATTAIGGANTVIEKTDWSPLNGKDVIIWPDNDPGGLKYAPKIAEYLTEQYQPASVSVIKLPQDKLALSREGKTWDAADAFEDGTDVLALLKTARNHILDSYSYAALRADNSPMPEDLIAPRVLTPGGMLVFGGAPKVGKSDFLFSMLAHMAGGAPFLGMHPPRPLKVFCLQAEIQYHYLRERLQAIQIHDDAKAVAGRNFFISGQTRMPLNESGVKKVIHAVNEYFSASPPDILVFDPIRNIFDGGKEGNSENDSNAMLFFLRERVEAIRQAVNPDAGVILVHHTRKISRQQFEEDPFQSLSGSSALRGYYTSGIMMYRKDDASSIKKLSFELRNGPAISDKFIERENGGWREIEHESERVAGKRAGEMHDAERERKHDAILGLVWEEARKGTLYTANQFALNFEGEAGFGSEKTIRRRIDALCTTGHIKFVNHVERMGFPKTKSPQGYLCVRDMELVDAAGEPHPILPTHYKCKSTGASLPVENPNVWVTCGDVTEGDCNDN